MKDKKKDIKSSLERVLENPRLKSQYLKEMEKVFQGPKGNPEHDKDLQKLHDSYGSPRFGKMARSYIKKYGLPDEWGALLLLLDLKKENETVIKVMEKLIEISKDRSSTEKKGLKSKLRTLSLTSKDIMVAETAEMLIEKI